MSKWAWIFVLGIISLSVVIIGFSLQKSEFTLSNLVVFGILVTIATLSQVYEVEGTFRNTYYPHSVFFFSGVILLDPFLFNLLIIVPLTLEWIVRRLNNSTKLKSWYLQPFNIATHILAGFATCYIYLFSQHLGLLDSVGGPLLVIGMALSYSLINHFLVGLALLTARGLSFHESGVMKLGSLTPDLALGCLGYIIALIWNYQPFMLPLALAPLILMYGALRIPKLTQDTQIDAKTSLLSAKYFNKIVSSEFDEAIRHNTNLCLLITDLDLMRNINDTFGHLAGDAVLSGVGKIIRQLIPDENHAGRFGGEEFAILLTFLNIEEARRIAESIRKEVEATPFIVETYAEPIKATISIGIACYPYNAKNVTELTYAADIAIYHAKRAGRNRVVAYSDLSKEEIQMFTRRPNVIKFRDSDEIVMQLRQAINDNQFELYYQPKVDMATGAIKGLEALIRWNHPDRGLVSPDEFISVAEETGLIMPIGKWILDEACLQVKVWNNFLRRNAPLVVSVNFSAIQFQREDVMESVTTALRETGIDPAWLEIEITETILMENTAYTINTLKRLKELGIKLAMDDFGIGYSSLGSLRNFPIDNLKIDRSFVTSLDKDEINQALIQAIVTLARKLNFSMVAEGVETEQERSKLYQLGCCDGQGYLFAKPMPALAIDELLTQERTKRNASVLSYL